MHWAGEHYSLTYFVNGSIAVWLVSSLTGLDSSKQETMLLLKCRKVTEYKPVKLETSLTEKLPPFIK